MKRLKNVFLLFLLLSCGKEEDFEFPLIQTGEVTNISSRGATFHAKLLQLEKSGIPEYGFVWGEMELPELGNGSQYLVIRKAPSKGTVSIDISTALKENRDYHVRAYAKGEKSLTYGRSVKFTSLGSGAPLLTGFYPPKGNLGDTITLLGENFSSRKELNKVSFNEQESEIIYACQDTLKVMVPSGLARGDAQISVSILENSASFDERFKLNVAEIHTFYPSVGNILDTITLVGKNFLLPSRLNSDAKDTQVTIGGYAASIVFLSSDSVRAVIPDKLDQENAEVSVMNSNKVKGSADSRFKLNTASVSGIAPLTAGFNELITLTGENFEVHEESLKVYFGEAEARIRHIGNQQLSVYVPANLNCRECPVAVKVNNIKKYADQKFQLAHFELSGFNPEVVITGQEMSISGTNFSPVPDNNIVKFANLQAEVISASTTMLMVKVPAQTVPYPSRDVTVSVEVLGEQQHFTEKAHINDQWFRLADYPGSATNNGIQYLGGGTSAINYKYAYSIGLNDKLYVGLNMTSDFWSYDPDENKWSQLAPFPGTPRFDAVIFSIDRKIYFGTGFLRTGTVYEKPLQDLWMYDPATNSWEKEPDVMIGGRKDAFGFTYLNEGYLGMGMLGRDDYDPAIYKYVESDGSWPIISRYPNMTYFGPYGCLSIVGEDKVYIGLGEYNWHYDYHSEIQAYSFTDNTWSSLPDFPFVGNGNNAIGFFVNNQLFLKTDFTNNFWTYRGSGNQWEQVSTNLLSDIRGGTAETWGNKAYVGLGSDNAFWEYDPNR